VPDTPAHRLYEIRHKLFGKLMLLLPSLESHAQFQKWEPSIGGRFPREIYQEIITRCTRISQYLSLTAQTIRRPPMTSEADTLWLSTLSTVLADVVPTQQSVISTLTLLSNSMRSGQSLPPFMSLPKPYELSRQLARLGGDAVDLLDAKNMEQTGYAEFAVLQVCSTLIYDDLGGLISAVTELVGVVDFSFKVEPSETNLMADESGDGDQEGKGKGKID
jgi:Aromatic acid exporter family member 2